MIRPSLGLPVVKFTFKDGEDPVAFVLSHNLHRRHLSESQRAAAVVACTSWAPPNRLKNKQATVPASSKTNAEMAKVAGTSERTVKDAKTAQRAGLIDEVKDGTISASGAAKIARGEPPKPEKKTAVQPIDDGPSAAEVAASERAAAEEFDALRKIALSDDKLAALLEENKQLRAMNRVLTERNNGLLNEKSELVKRVKSLQRKLEQPA